MAVSINRAGMSPCQSSSGKNIWDLAVEALSSQDREHIYFDCPVGQDKLAVLEGLRNAAEEQKNQCMAKRWKIQRKNKEPIILRDVIDKILVWVEKFSQIGNCVAQYDPVHAALPWAGIRLILQIAINDSQVFSTVLEGMERISNLIGRYAIFEELYLNSDLKSYEGLVRCLTELYTRVLVYLSKAKQYYSKSTATRILITSDGFESLLKGIIEKQSEVDQFASLADAESYRDLRIILDDLAGPIDRINNHIHMLQDNLKDAKRLEVLKWISTIPYSQHHNNIRRDRLPDSGLWLLQKEEYKSWRKSSSCSILWLHGIPGSGKSKLVSLVIDTLRGTTSGCSEPVAYFYCTRDPAEPKRENPEEILRCILKQLSYQKPGFQILEPIKKKYEKLQNESPEPRELTLDESKKLIVDITEIYPSVTIVIDALDECNLETRCYLMNALEDIVLQSENLVKVFVSSRDDRDIVWKLKDWSNLYIQTSDNTEDIRRFVDFQIEESIRMRKFLGGHISDGLKRHLVKSLIEGAHGMFRWVSLQLQNLCSPRMVLEEDVLKELRQLPKTLTGMYDKIYRQISESAAPTQLIIESVLKWLLCAQRQLKTQEFLAAVSIDSKGVYTEVSTQQVLDMCCNLVILDKDLDVFRFAHLSVREYLEKRDEYESTIAHTLAAERCLFSCLTLNDNRGLGDPAVETNNAFRNYAILYWATHCQMSGDHRRGGMLKELFCEFVLQDLALTPSFEEWKRSVIAYLEPMPWDATEAKFVSMCSESTDPFFASCVWGFCEVVERCLQSKKETLQRHNVRGRSGLHTASRYAQSDVVRLLLEAGVDVNARSIDGNTALHAAAERGSREVVQLLVEKGANVEVMDENNGTALHLASKGGNTTVVQLLLEKRADVSAKDGNGQTALHLAAEGGNEEIVKLLLRNEAKVEAQDDLEMRPLHGAAERGHEAIVRMLLDNGAIVNAKNKSGWMALDRAVEKGHEAVARLLLLRGADIRGRDGGWSPLHWAAERGNEGIVLLLLEKGADSTIKDSFGMTPLHRTARTGHNIVILRLLENGAEIEATDEHGCTALYHAAEEGRESVVRLLLGKGANVGAKSNEGRTSLHQAAGRGREDVLRLLLKNGADVGARDNYGVTPLHQAAVRGHEEVLRLLLENGADVGARDNYGVTPLHQAAMRGHESSVLTLLEKGADVYAKDKVESTALHYAATSGKEAVVPLILEKGKDVKVDNLGRLALHWAAETGHKEVVRLLLLEKGLDIDKVDNYVMTALILAAGEGHADIVELLLEEGADPAMEDYDGNTALNWAAEEGYEEVVHLLHQATLRCYN